MLNYHNMNYEKPDGRQTALRGDSKYIIYKERIFMCGFNFGNGNSCCWIIIILLILWFCCGNNNMNNDHDCSCRCECNNSLC